MSAIGQATVSNSTMSGAVCHAGRGAGQLTTKRMDADSRTKEIGDLGNKAESETRCTITGLQRARAGRKLATTDLLSSGTFKRFKPTGNQSCRRSPSKRAPTKEERK